MFTRMFAAILAASCLFLASGCSLFNPIDPLIQIGIAWVEGEATKYYNTDQTTLINATKAALKELDMPYRDERESGNTFRMTAGDQGSDKFRIRVVAVRHNVAKLCIRVNIMGDKPYAELIYKKVDEQSSVRQFVSERELNRAIND